MSQKTTKLKSLDTKIKEFDNATLDNTTKSVTNMFGGADFGFSPNPSTGWYHPLVKFIQGSMTCQTQQIKTSTTVEFSSLDFSNMEDAAKYVNGSIISVEYLGDKF